MALPCREIIKVVVKRRMEARVRRRHSGHGIKSRVQVRGPREVFGPCRVVRGLDAVKQIATRRARVRRLERVNGAGLYEKRDIL